MIGAHLVLSAYGFWLPNDPRGSWSKYVGSQKLYAFGPATPTTERRSLAHDEHSVQLRFAAKEALKYPPVRFNEEQVRAVGAGFGQYLQKSDWPVWACAILPDHVHMVVGEHRLSYSQLAVQLKGEAVKMLVAQGCHPMACYAEGGNLPKVFARGEWMVHLHREGQVHHAIDYTQDNLSREGLPAQRWDFVVPYSS